MKTTESEMSFTFFQITVILSPKVTARNWYVLIAHACYASRTDDPPVTSMDQD